ncbi:hypothetical protein CRG98_037977, partial [Punica granatum]
MALRSSCLFGRRPPPSDRFSIGTRLPGKLALPLDKSKKFISAFGDASSGSLEIQNLPLMGKGKLLSHHYGAVLKQLSAHQ